MVRQSGHRGFVGGDLAQRSVRDVDGNQGERAFQPAVERTPAAARMDRPDNDRRRGRGNTRDPAGAVSESSVFDVFDSITYNKGGAVLAMLEEWIGKKTFRDGLARYMKDRQFSNATAGDLWHHMQLASGQNISDVAMSWTDQKGFPVVQVSSSCADGRTIVQMSQSRFSLGAQPLPPQQWKIPIVLARGAERRSLLLDQPVDSAAFDGCPNLPLLANPDGLGFYRVAYDSSTLQRLTASFAYLTPAQQVVVLSDTFALAQAGLVTMPEYFRLLAAVPQVGSAGQKCAFFARHRSPDILGSGHCRHTGPGAVRASARSLLESGIDAPWLESREGGERR